METLEINRTCKACGKKLLGRSDKQCCDDQCRANHNRKLKQESRDLTSARITEIQRILLTNYNILCRLFALGESMVERSTMVNLGFHFGYMTGVVEKRHSLYVCCFDKAYLCIGEDVLIMDVASLEA